MRNGKPLGRPANPLVRARLAATAWLRRRRFAHEMDRLAHRAGATGDGLRFRHQTGAETALLDPVARTTDIDVDFVVTQVFGDLGRCHHLGRLGAAQLQGQGTFFNGKPK